MLNHAGEHITECGPADAIVLTHIWRESILHRAAPAFSKSQIKAWVSRVRTPEIYAQEARSRRIWGWVENDDIIAFIELEPDGHIDRLYALKAAQGRGIATHLIRHVIGVARQGGLMRLYTEASDLARPAFERCGFQTLHKNPVQIDGVSMHNWIMECDVSRM